MAYLQRGDLHAALEISDTQNPMSETARLHLQDVPSSHNSPCTRDSSVSNIPTNPHCRQLTDIPNKTAVLHGGVGESLGQQANVSELYSCRFLQFYKLL